MIFGCNTVAQGRHCGLKMLFGGAVPTAMGGTADKGVHHSKARETLK